MIRIDDFWIIKDISSKCTQEGVTFKNDGREWFAEQDQGELCSIASIKRIRDGQYLIGSCFTLESHRKKGIMAKLLKGMIESKGSGTFVAYCLDSSIGIFKRLGFEERREYETKRFKCHYAVLRKEK